MQIQTYMAPLEMSVCVGKLHIRSETFSYLEFEIGEHMTDKHRRERVELEDVVFCLTGTGWRKVALETL